MSTEQRPTAQAAEEAATLEATQAQARDTDSQAQEQGAVRECAPAPAPVAPPPDPAAHGRSVLSSLGADGRSLRDQVALAGRWLLELGLGLVASGAVRDGCDVLAQVRALAQVEQRSERAEELPAVAAGGEDDAGSSLDAIEARLQAAREDRQRGARRRHTVAPEEIEANAGACAGPPRLPSAQTEVRRGLDDALFGLDPIPEGAVPCGRQLRADRSSRPRKGKATPQGGLQ